MTEGVVPNRPVPKDAPKVSPKRSPADSLSTRVVSEVRRWIGESSIGLVTGWDRFWFTPRLPHTVALVRIATGAMLLYAHLVLATDLMSFLGDNAWINNETSRQLHDGAFGPSDWSRSYLWYISSPALLWMHHAFTLVVTAAFMIGFLTRITAPLAWFLQLMYLHRLTGALFGLDQIMTYAAMYTMIAPCGAKYSVDAWLRDKFADRRSSSSKLMWLLPEAVPSVSANIATRLLQVHLCVIYLFGGLAKARGTSWWDGTAVWYAIANYEYQSIDLTWLGSYPRLFSALSHVTMFWEIFYCALVWPKLTRPFVLAMAVAVHGGIALFMGMATFGIMMIVANCIFLDPAWFAPPQSADEPTDTESTDAETIDEPSDVAASIDSELVDFESVDLEPAALEPANRDSASADSADPEPAELEPTGVESAVDAGLIDTPAKRESKTPLDEREQRVRKAAKKVKSRYARLKEREAKFKARAQRLKEREAKVRRFVLRQRDKKNKRQSDDSSE
tara:strand:- start:17350 stop:18864 length:1515 start_codon:yes stop_codon:yes gene_type:complete